MVMMDDVFKYFIFFNERIKSAINKPRFFFYYSPNQTASIQNSLTITIIPHATDEKILQIRVSRAPNLQVISSFKNTFSKLLGLYKLKYQNTENIYTELLPRSKSLIDLYTKTSKVDRDDKKTGRRLTELKKKRPDIFPSNYSSVCQPKSRQPYIVDKKEGEKLIKKFGEYKVLSSSMIPGYPSEYKDYFVCEPREPGEKGDYVWPGLQRNTKLYNKEKYPLLPCCFTSNQYTKEKGGLADILDKFKAPKFKSEDMGHILGSNKRLPEDRYGEIPFYLGFVVQSAGYTSITKGQQTILPILRLGVIGASDSFLHCMEKAFNMRYSSLSDDGKIKRIIQIRENLSKMNFAVARQELYDYTNEEIKGSLLDESVYLDPGVWIRLIEVYYNCNIFIYKINDDHPNGEIAIPRHSQAYLMRKTDVNLPTVFIVKNSIGEANETKDKKYQCELLIEYNPTGPRDKRFVFAFGDNKLVEQARLIFDKANDVSVVTPEDSFKYLPVKI